MTERSIIHRFIMPLTVAVGTMAVSSLVYHGSSGMGPGAARTIIKDVSGGVMFLSLWFFAFIGPPLAYFRGAGFVERLIVAFANPVIWVIRMAMTVSCQFSAVEMVYFFFLPWTFGAVCVALFEFSLAELACRAVDRRRGGGTVRVFHPLVVALLALGMSGVYFGLIRGQEWAYVVVNHYADHFVR
ncbi:MAG TPA: hypothetical protein ENN21_01550 [Spirochaetes bacterium]|nr:hypothetical protein [Spirochaetota bacterium]